MAVKLVLPLLCLAACGAQEREPLPDLRADLALLELRAEKAAQLADAAIRIDAAQTAMMVASSPYERRLAKVAWLHASSNLHVALQPPVVLARRGR